MTKKKQVSLLLLALLVFVLVYVGLNAYNSWKQKEEAASAITAVNLDAEDIQQITYTNTLETVTCEKEDGTWYNSADRNFPLKQSCAENAVSSFAKITANRILDQPDDLSGYGLDDPAYSVTLTDTRGNETEVWIGSAASNSDYYLTADGGNTVYTVSSLILDNLIFEESQLLQLETFPEIDSATLKSLTIEKKGKTLSSCSAEEEDDADLISVYGSELSNIVLDECANYNVKKKELEKYGLDADTKKTVTAVYTDTDSEEEQTQVFYLGTVFEEDGTDYVYLRLKGSRMVYKVYVSQAETLLADE
ncbi:DUF4340 domain-containing protein [bacterium 210820-DFI.6.37]|nr:DUF4340 domain-containing protein [bacterium 210820-DFI.6.37]